MAERRLGGGRIAVDSSVLVAAFASWHELHDAAFAALESALSSKDGVVLPSDVLVETYSVLTRLPAPHRLSSRDALELMRGSLAHVAVADAPPAATWRFLADLAGRDVKGGAVYDARIVAAALRAGASAILTLNARDFERLAPETFAVIDPSKPEQAST